MILFCIFVLLMPFFAIAACRLLMWPKWGTWLQERVITEDDGFACNIVRSVHPSWISAIYPND
jgi:hypothetical protein